ncbi:MAG: SUMF1/EgtB/PvdO family nonheme iron enzyme [Lentisphaeria bacterium]|nr:SUMF1/EgtB/PvdO family nonheme iron enzyme [Lentisphaeria bacterium]
MFKKLFKYSALLGITLLASTSIAEESNITQGDLRAELDLINPKALKESITFLSRKYRRKYPRGKQYLSQVDSKMASLEILKKQLQAKPETLFTANLKDLKITPATNAKKPSKAVLKDNKGFDHTVVVKGGKITNGALQLTATTLLGTQTRPGKNFSYAIINLEKPTPNLLVSVASQKVKGNWWKWHVDYQTAGSKTWKQPENMSPQWDNDKFRGPIQMNGKVTRFRIKTWSTKKYHSILGVKSITVQQRKMAPIALVKKAQDLIKFNRQVLLDNPVINFDEIMIIARQTHGTDFGFPWNWQSNTSIRNHNIPSTISKISVRNPRAPLKTVFKPENNKIVSDLEVDFNAKKMMFSAVDNARTWHVYETDINGKNIRQISPNDGTDVDSFESVYLPDGKIIYSSTTGFQGVPCVGGSDYVGNLHVIDADGKNVRRLTFDQDSNWDPVVTNDGRIIYQRWEYTDSAHYYSRVLMQMNPDGTNQRGLYGSNSYWPNTQFNARPVPGSSSKFVAIVSGHHGVKREGEIILFDTRKGGKETEGVVQRIGGKEKKVTGAYKDNYAGSIWPRYTHPYPLSANYVLASGRMNSRQSHQGIYLLDTFGNRLLIKKSPGLALIEPIPVKRHKRPPVIPSKVRLGEKEGTLYVADIYLGPGLKGVPRGTVKKLRVFEYEYAYRSTGGHYNIGLEGPWDVRNILGTVDVHPDGSVMFKVPANRPLAIQPLDGNGRALQQMRSWLTVMPGETLACVGCHEDINTATPVRRNKASTLPPQKIKPWYGPARGFSFEREVQPVLDRRCIGCHDGKLDGAPNFKANQGKKIGPFSMAYYNLMRYIRRNGPEGDYTLLNPAEFHANTSRLFQLMEKGHHNVKLTKEEHDRLVTWADINVPYFGTWHEATPKLRNNKLINRRQELRLKYGNISVNVEDISSYKPKKVKFIYPKEEKEVAPKHIAVKGWPMTAKKAGELQAARKPLNIKLNDKESLKLVSIPAGSFVMGDNHGYNDEKPVSKQTIAKPFYMSTTEITLGQFRAFKSDYSNGWLDMHYKDQVRPGYNMDLDKNFPVVRVTWKDAIAYCKWLSKKTGKKVRLPSESQWEWAARAGTNSQLSYGTVDTDFSKFANLADHQLKKFAVSGIDPKPIRNPSPYFDWELRDDRFDDGSFLLTSVGKYKPNAFGLYDMIGNVAEWTTDDYKPYPYKASKLRSKKRKVVRGGSWYDRPIRARSAYRLAFPQWQRIYNVGFRVIIED